MTPHHTPQGQAKMVEIGDKNEASEAVINGFMMTFLCVLAFCMIMNHYIGHKFHVRARWRGGGGGGGRTGWDV